jgi:hypothetical protein
MSEKVPTKAHTAQAAQEPLVVVEQRRLDLGGERLAQDHSDPLLLVRQVFRLPALLLPRAVERRAKQLERLLPRLAVWFRPSPVSDLISQ